MSPRLNHQITLILIIIPFALPSTGSRRPRETVSMHGQRLRMRTPSIYGEIGCLARIRSAVLRSSRGLHDRVTLFGERTASKCAGTSREGS